MRQSRKDVRSHGTDEDDLDSFIAVSVCISRLVVLLTLSLTVVVFCSWSFGKLSGHLLLQAPRASVRQTAALKLNMGAGK